MDGLLFNNSLCRTQCGRTKLILCGSEGSSSSFGGGGSSLLRFSFSFCFFALAFLRFIFAFSFAFRRFSRARCFRSSEVSSSPGEERESELSSSSSSASDEDEMEEDSSSSEPSESISMISIPSLETLLEERLLRRPEDRRRRESFPRCASCPRVLSSSSRSDGILPSLLSFPSFVPFFDFLSSFLLSKPFRCLWERKEKMNE